MATNNIQVNPSQGRPAHITMEAFSPKSGKWKVYLARLEQQFLAQQVNDPAMKKAHLLSVIGSEVCELIWDLFEPQDPASETVTYQMICDKLTTQFVPITVEIAQRFQLYQRKQKPGESVSEFLTALRQLATGCAFGNFLQSALRDVFVFGLRDATIQKKLLTIENLTLEEAVKEANCSEAIEKQAKGMQEPKTICDEQIHLLRSRCNRCEGEHPSDTCRFRFLNCNKCGKRGHKASVCYSKSRAPQLPHKQSARFSGAQKTTATKNRNQASNLNYVDDMHAEESEVELYRLEEVNHVHNGEVDPPIYTEIQLNGHNRRMEIDTGAGSTIISETTWKELGGPSLRPSWIRLKTYTGQSVKVKGEFDALVRIGETQQNLPVLVAEGNGPDLIGRKWLRRVKLNWNKILKITMDDLSKRLAPFEEIFETEIGTIRAPPVRLELNPGAVPKFNRARPIPYALREGVKSELKRLEDSGIIEQINHSDWAAPIVVVKKENGALRICGDYKVTINEVLVVDQYPLPIPEDLFATLEGGAWFTKLDLSQAYLQLELDVDSRNLTTINTPFGLFRYTRMPFGISCAPSKFQKVMDDLFRDLDWVKVFLDDILIAGRSLEEHWSRVLEILRRLRSAGVRLKREKCHFAVRELPYLGHIVSHEGLKASPNKVKAITDAARPTNLSSLKSFLGLVQYYGKFIPRLAELAAPLYKLQKKSNEWVWSTDQEKSWNALKKALSSTEVLCAYRPELPLRLACDASPFGVAAVLSHVMPDGIERPIAYASKTLSASEQNYSQLDKEALAIVFGVRRFHRYIYGRMFTLITDHKPLLGILGPKNGIPPLAAARMQRWALILAAYRYKLEFRRTEDHSNVDAFSRFPLPSSNDSSVGMPPETLYHVEFFESNVTREEVKSGTQADPILKRVFERLKKGWRPEDGASELGSFHRKRNDLSLCDGLILWGRRVVIPAQLRPQLLKILHEDHQGIVRMKNLARSYVWWPNIDQNLADTAADCLECQKNRNVPKKTTQAVWPIPAEPWERLHLDYAGPVDGKYLLVLVDASSKWPEIFTMTSTTTSATIEALRTTFARFGHPLEIVTDNGPQFSSKEFQDYLKRNGIAHRMGAPYHPETNGLAERMVQSVKKAISKMDKEPGNLLTKVQRFLHSYRKTAHGTTGISPAKAMLGRELRSRLDLLQPPKRPTTDVPVRFEVGQPVLAREFRLGKEKWVKGVVERRIGAYLFLVRAGDLILKRHVDQMLPSTRESNTALLEKQFRNEKTCTEGEKSKQVAATVPKTLSISWPSTAAPTNSSGGAPTPVVARTPTAEQISQPPGPRRSDRSRKPPTRLDL